MGDSATAWLDDYQKTEYDKLGWLKRRQQDRVANQFSESVIDHVYQVLGRNAAVPANFTRLPERNPADSKPRARVPSPAEIGINRIARIFETSGFNDLKEFSTRIPTEWVNARHRGQTALTVAAYSGSVEWVRLLLSDSNILINDVNDYGSTALMLAVQEGQLTIVKLLLADERLDIFAMNQWEKALKKSRHPLITELLKKKMRDQKSTLSIFKKLISFVSR